MVQEMEMEMGQRATLQKAVIWERTKTASLPMWQNYQQVRVRVTSVCVHVHVCVCVCACACVCVCVCVCVCACVCVCVCMCVCMCMYVCVLSTSSLQNNSEINMKQQLVEQLEKAQKTLGTMKQQYEDKMKILQQQIKSTEVERDKVLKEICKSKKRI